PLPHVNLSRQLSSRGAFHQDRHHHPLSRLLLQTDRKHQQLRPPELLHLSKEDPGARPPERLRRRRSTGSMRAINVTVSDATSRHSPLTNKVSSSLLAIPSCGASTRRYAPI